MSAAAVVTGLCLCGVTLSELRILSGHSICASCQDKSRLYFDTGKVFDPVTWASAMASPMRDWRLW